MTLRPRLRLPAAYAYGVLALLSLIVGAIAIIYSASYTNSAAARQDQQAAKLNAAIAQLRTQQLAACGSAGDIGSIPIPAKPRPSKLAISLVSDSRAEWRALHCPGTLPTAQSLGLARWAKAYHLNPS